MRWDRSEAMQKSIDKEVAKFRWHTWYAWHPVRTYKYPIMWIWLEPVIRCLDGEGAWVYARRLEG